MHILLVIKNFINEGVNNNEIIVTQSIGIPLYQ